MSDNFQMVLPIPPEATLGRLADAIDVEAFERKIAIKFRHKPTFMGTKEFIGKIEGNVFRVRRRPRYRSSFITFLTGVVEPTATGSQITASFPRQSFRVAKIILTVVGSLVLVPFLILALITLIAWLSGRSDIATLTGFVLLIAVVFVSAFLGIASIFGGMLLFAKRQRRSESAAILEFVKSIYRDVAVAK